MRNAAAILAVLAVIAAAAFFYLTMPQPLTAAAVPQHTPDLANGERMYHIGGCISCHRPSDSDPAADPSLPSGGFSLRTPAGTFYSPNITPDRETGIGAWSDVDFLNAMQRGISRGGEHYIPAFPYTSYARMRPTDVLDLKAHLMNLKPVRSERRAPEFPLGLPVDWLARRSIGLWKRGAMPEGTFEPDPTKSETWNRGAYLVTAPGHCGECHTPRNFLMMPKTSARFAGGPHPEGDGKVPSLIDLIGRERYNDVADLTAALQFGETFGYEDISDGGMGSVQINISKLPQEDIDAIAEYLASLK